MPPSWRGAGGGRRVHRERGRPRRGPPAGAQDRAGLVPDGVGGAHRVTEEEDPWNSHPADRGALKPDLTPSEAADVLWLLNDPSVYHRLVIEQHWDPDRYQDWLTSAFISLLIPESYQPKT